MTDQRLHVTLGDKLAALGFSQSKKFVYAKVCRPFIQYVLISKQRARGEYDLSCGIRHEASNFPALAMIGPTSGPDNQIVNATEYFKARICWSKISPSIEECADKIYRLVVDHHLPWFERQMFLVKNSHNSSALRREDKHLVEQGSSPGMSETTAALIGLKPNQAIQAVAFGAADF